MPPNDDDQSKNKNPWGHKAGHKSGHDDRGPWSAGGSRGNLGGRNNDAPDLDDMIRRAQDNFRNVMPGNVGGLPF
ncbi:MAG: protease modulator HflK N-terminal domain-containing protein, partial [Bdellovibrionales bacterium]